MTGGRPESSCLFYGCVSFGALCTEGLLRVREGPVHIEAVFCVGLRVTDALHFRQGGPLDMYARI